MDNIVLHDTLRHMSYHLRLRAFALGVLPLAAVWAQQTHARAAGASAAAAVQFEPFCARTGRADPAASVARDHFWSADEVHARVVSLAKSEPFRCSPHGAYVFAYARMTAARDAERCTKGSEMAGRTPLDARLNDALSDMMTRNYLQLVEHCVSAGVDAYGAPRRGLSSMWCDLHDDAQRENWDALRVALGSTALYLSAHLTMALSALPHVDALWRDTPFTTIAARTERLREFKPTYDAFNGFLAGSLTTVTDALADAGLLRGDLAGTGAAIFGLLPVAGMTFGSVRDDSFETGLRIARATPRGEHPWTELAPGGEVAMARSVLEDPRRPSVVALTGELERLEWRASALRGLFANPLLRVLHAHDFATLARDGERCQEQVASF